MDIDILPLSPEMLNDYLNYFDNIAFADHPDWSQCYCIHFHWQSQWKKEPPRYNRDRIIEHISASAIQGYLAYYDGKVVGWCNANDKTNYAALKHNIKLELRKENQGKKVKSVVCFLVVPGMRRKGIATKLLERICTDSKAEGYDFIQCYPPAGTYDMYVSHHGTVSLYEKCGFNIYKQLGNDCIMRKYLGNG